ncbi:MAG TPA: lamin tail domain-containing protein [Candidatus Paceibacterota bacterium]
MNKKINFPEPEEEIIDLVPSRNGLHKKLLFVLGGIFIGVIVLSVFQVGIFRVMDTEPIDKNEVLKESQTGFVGSLIDKVLDKNDGKLVEIIDVKSGEVIKFDEPSKDEFSVSADSSAGQITIKECDFDEAGVVVGGGIKINEVAWMGSSESSNHEWIELKNVSASGIDISNWYLIDKDNQIKIRFPKNSLIKNNSFYLLERGEEASSSKADLIYSGSLKNSDEGLRLFNTECALIDEVFAKEKWPAGDNLLKTTMERSIDGLWYSSQKVGGTPGLENSDSTPPYNQSNYYSQTSYYFEPTYYSESLYYSEATYYSETAYYSESTYYLESLYQASPPAQEPVYSQASYYSEASYQTGSVSNVLISEILPGLDGQSNYEFIELYNPSDEQIDLTGWELRKKNSSGNESNLVDNGAFTGSIPAHGYFLVASPGYNGSPSPDIIYSVASGSFAYDDNSIVLYNGDYRTANIIDEISWAEISAGQSYERDSWSSNSFHIQSNPNPQNSNN